MASWIDRVIWVWPHWDAMQHKDGHSTIIMKLGFFKRKVKDNEETSFCFCQNLTLANEVCIYLTNDDNQDTDVAVLDSDTICSIVKVYQWEQMNVQEFDMLSTTTWLRDEEDVLLDIDEDYWGVHSKPDDLTAVGINETTVIEMNESIQKIVCKITAQTEKEVDMILRRIVKMVMHERRSHLETYTYARVHKEIMEYVYSKQNQGYCLNGSFGRFIELLLHRSQDQLKVISDIGFCAHTLVVNSDAAFGLCSGANEPNSTIITIHNPTEHEIVQQSQLVLKALISLLRDHKDKVLLVTIARSGRDGFTPNQYQQYIESLLLKGLKDIFGVIDIEYSPNLLGGRTGWI